MGKLVERSLPADLASELERKFFWWENVSSEPRSHARILAQAMSLASFDDIRHLERTLGHARLAEAMLQAEPGWFSDRSWELWRGRLSLATGQTLPAAPPRRSFLGGDGLGRLNDPLQTDDSTLLVASMEDLLATKLKAILDRAESKDYRDIAAMLSAGVSLERALGAFAKMYGKDPGLPLRAMGFFEDGDLSSLSKSDQDVLRAARDRVADIPLVSLAAGLCPA